jgi:hypothetical protein
MVHKNSWGPPHTDCEFQFHYDGHIDIVDEVAVESVTAGVVGLNGAWYKYGKQKWQGIDAFYEALASDKKMLDEIEAKTRQKMKEGWK